MVDPQARSKIRLVPSIRVDRYASNDAKTSSVIDPRKAHATVHYAPFINRRLIADRTMRGPILRLFDPGGHKNEARSDDRLRNASIRAFPTRRGSELAAR